MRSKVQIDTRSRWWWRWDYRAGWRHRHGPIFVAAVWWCFAYWLNATYLLQMSVFTRDPQPIATLPSEVLTFAAVLLFAWELIPLVRLRPRAIRVFLVGLQWWSLLISARLLVALWTRSWGLSGGWAALLLLAINLLIAWLLRRYPSASTAVSFRSGMKWALQGSR